jgi:biopolymer transport protein ExbD
MASKRKYFDVWIVETDAVYRQVPYTVVADWIQQGRLLEEDMLRSAGGSEWARLETLPELAPYLPKSDPHRADDQAEALERVQIDFKWRNRAEEGDEDVDMIPLIDVSLVLLIFFMMTATVATAGGLFINTPEAHNAHSTSDPRIIWIGIERADGKELYALGLGDRPVKQEDQKLTEDGLLERLDQLLAAEPVADVNIKADRELPYEVVKRMTVALEVRKARGQIRKTFAGVSERESP